MKKYKVAVAGATGAVGREMIRMLEELDFPVGELFLLASYRSAGKKLKFRGGEIEVAELAKNWIEKNRVDIVLMSAGGAVSKEYAPLFKAKKAYVIDNSSAWRMDKDVPLIVPEINPRSLKKGSYIIANPNCSTIQMVHALAPVHRISKIIRVVVTTFQAVSGAGQKAITELEDQTKKIVDGNFSEIELPRKNFSAFTNQIAFNCIPQIDVFLEDNYTKEEIKMVGETKKILGEEISVTATCVRVPVFRGHSEAVNIELEKELPVELIREVLEKEANIAVIDDISNLKYPMPIDAAGKFETFVGRIRRDVSRKNCYWLWVVSDNLLKGAALNAVQIAKELIKII